MEFQKSERKMVACRELLQFDAASLQERNRPPLVASRRLPRRSRRSRSGNYGDRNNGSPSSGVAKHTDSRVAPAKVVEDGKEDVETKVRGGFAVVEVGETRAFTGRFGLGEGFTNTVGVRLEEVR
ncbi:hypothetical protein LR48_Vigan01g123400 [Vigna angularis]|uniref:Uncharacterized protein n=1 Tax=Phaseolus angularis TaxID=3914 RepID=A0A0L9TNC4_PHAAN|nr:hypothetical protein LR48_Vigan01g123400 [Vigna angularis]